MTNLPCKQCGFENEIQRIYCHNCGVKLDRSSLPQENKAPISLEKQRRRLKRLTNPGGGFWGGWKSNLPNTLLLAAMLATLIQAVRPPDGAPPPRKKGEYVDAPQIMLKMGNIMATHLMMRVSIGQADANAYLLNYVKAEDQDLPFIGKEARFDRVYVTMEEGSCLLTMSQLLHNYPFYLGSRYRIEIKGGKLQAKNIGGCIGRMPIHPLLMQSVELAFGGLWDTLKREKALLDKMQSVEVHKGQIILVTKADAPQIR